MNVKTELLSKLQKVVEILNKNEIHFWMYGGALLGYVRDGDLIPWNRDIDLFVWTTEYPKVLRLKKEFKRLGLKVSVREKSVMLIWEDNNISIARYDLQGDYALWIKLCTRNKFGTILFYGVLCKVVEYHLDKTYRFLKWFLLKTGGCYLVEQRVPSHFYLNLKEINFYGIKLKVPAETEKYFEYTFGVDWRTPIKDFQYEKEYIHVIQGKISKSLKYHSGSIRSEGYDGRHYLNRI